MQKKMNIILLLAIVAVTLILSFDLYAVTEFDPASGGGASATMDEVYCDVRALAIGNVGTLIGFGMALGGLIMLLLKGSNYGVFLILIGISFTAFPGFINTAIVSMSKLSSEAEDITKIGECNASGKLKSVVKLPSGATINAIGRRSTYAPSKDDSLWDGCDPGPC